MKFFADTAEVSEIRELADMGLLDGVTTNPTLVAKSGRAFKEVVAEICSLVAGPVSAEVISLEAEGMVREARELLKIAKNVAIKVPMTHDGLKACRALSGEGVMVNVTLCFSANQALLAAKAGATFISPFIGRLDDIHLDGMELISEISLIYDNYGFETEILAASIRSANHVKQAALVGADIAHAVPLTLLAGTGNWLLGSVDLGLLGLAQFVPMIALTLVVGHVVDRYDHRLILLGCQLAEAGAAAILAFGTATGWLDPAVIYTAMVVAGSARAFEIPTMVAIIPALVPRAIVPQATAYFATANQAGSVIGPLLGGYLYGQFGLGPVTVHGAAIALMLPHIKSKAVKVLGVSSARRASSLPDVPTLIERGINVVGQSPYGLVGPKGMPPQVVDAIYATFREAMNDAKINEYLAKFIQGRKVAPSSVRQADRPPVAVLQPGMPTPSWRVSDRSLPRRNFVPIFIDWRWVTDVARRTSRSCT